MEGAGLFAFYPALSVSGCAPAYRSLALGRRLTIADISMSGQGKGRKSLHFKRAARAELASGFMMLSHANVMLNMVKAFECVPHQWLVRQGMRYGCPMQILRLSIAAHLLARSICIEGVCSRLLDASCGITAGAAHATIELRLLLIEWLGDTVRLYLHMVVTAYVDDTSFEASGSSRSVGRTVIWAMQAFMRGPKAVGI